MIPEKTQAALDRYVTYGVIPGPFLQAVLRHDLFGSFQYASPENRDALREIVLYVHNYMPGNCHGSRKIVEEWIAERGRDRCVTA